MKSKNICCIVTVLVVVFVAIGLLPFRIYAESSGSRLTEVAKLANQVYTDPKGFFKIRPPAGWTVEEYSADPRGKVNFNFIEGSMKIQLKLIASSNPFDNFEALLQDCQNGVERLRARMRGKYKVSAITFLNQKAVEVLMFLASGFKQRQVQLMAGGNYYTIVFGTHRQLYNKYLPLVKASMETLEILPKQAKSGEARAHIVASKIRLARLYIQIGRQDWALISINEGLTINPQNEELLRLKMEVETIQKEAFDQALAKVAYIDPKGFFEITPPKDWNRQEYPQDPRGKVAFFAPDKQADLRILAKAVDIPDYDALIEDLKSKEKQLGVRTNIEPIVFSRMPAVKRLTTITMQGVTLRLLLVDLLVGGISHNIQYCASPGLFAKYQETAWKSMLTYKPLKRAKQASPEEARKHEVAKWIRLAKIALEMGKIQAAKEAVAAGLETDPQNIELKQMKSNLEKK